MRIMIDTNVIISAVLFPQGKQDSEPFKTRLNIAEIKKTLQELTENAESGISHELIKKFVSRVTPTSDTSFDWYVKLGVARRTKATYTVSGRRKNGKTECEKIEELPVDFSRQMNTPHRLPSPRNNLMETD